MSSHDEIVRQEFAKQAVTFEDPAYSFADQRLMGWILEHVPCEPGAMVLDAGGGTGHVARAYADIAALAVVLDVTEEMLVTGRGEAEASGLRNLLFMVGDATRMPFLDESFDLVVSRFAVHHFERPALQIAEIVRVCRAGSRVAIIDLVAADEALAAQHDRLERLRDPSHVRALPASELSRSLEEAGAPIVHKAFHEQPLSVDRWLSQAQTPPEIGRQIRSELESELDRGAATGMRPLVRKGELHFTQRWAILVAEKPTSRPPK